MISVHKKTKQCDQFPFGLLANSLHFHKVPPNSSLNFIVISVSFCFNPLCTVFFNLLSSVSEYTECLFRMCLVMYVLTIEMKSQNPHNKNLFTMLSFLVVSKEQSNFGLDITLITSVINLTCSFFIWSLSFDLLHA